MERFMGCFIISGVIICIIIMIFTYGSPIGTEQVSLIASVPAAIIAYFYSRNDKDKDSN